MTVLDTLKRGTSYLTECGVDNPRAEADIILAFIRGIGRDRLYLTMDEELSEEQGNLFLQMIQQRGERIPLAYILKIREFMGLPLYVDERVLIPRPETELIVEKMLELAKNCNPRSVRVLDLCTGSGAIAVSCAYYCPKAEVTAIDISPAALEVAGINAAKFKTAVEFRLGDLFAPVEGQKFDFLLSNPPYVRLNEYRVCGPEVKKEPSLALLGGEDGLTYYRRLARQARGHLYSNGVIILEIGCCQGKQVSGLFRSYGFRSRVYQDLAGLDRMVVAWKQKD